MATGGSTPELDFQDRLHKKKMMVDELLALRRTRLLQKKHKPLKPIPNSQSPTTGRIYEAYNVLHNSGTDSSRVTVSQGHVRRLIKGTALEEELNATYGARGIEDATESYTRESSSNVSRNNNSNYGLENMGGVATQRLFFHRLMKERRLKLEAMKQRRFDKEQELILKKENLLNARAQLLEKDGKQVSIEADSDDENLKQLVDEAKHNISHLEEKLRHLKREQLSKKIPQRIFKKPPAIDYEFKPWQTEQASIATDIVNDIIKSALDICVYSEDNLEAKLLTQLLKSDTEAWERASRQETLRDTVIDIFKEIEEEVSTILIRKIAEEFVFVQTMIKVSATDLVINSSYTAVHNRPLKDKKSKGIGQTWIAIVNHRAASRQNLWSHSKGVVSKVEPSSTSIAKQPDAVSVVEENDDYTLLSYGQTPLTENRFTGEIWDEYVKAEYSLWESSNVVYTPSAFDLSHQKITGVSCLSISTDHRYIAIGTFHGDIIVYDVTFEPFRPIRCVAFSGKRSERILRISWSMDGSRIISVSDSFCVIVWSISYPSPPANADLKALGIPDDKDTQYHCYQLTLLAIFEASLGDFNIIEGSLAASVTQTVFSNPLIAVFSPASNATGSQNFLIVGFSSGELVKCDLTMIMASRLSGLLGHQPSRPNIVYINGNALLSTGNKILDDIEVDLYRFHKFPILEIHFVQNNGDMVSIDQHLNMAIWKDSKDYLAGSNWIIPFRKFRVNGAEIVMTPKGEEKIIFEDEATLKKQAKKSKKRKAKNTIEQERKEALSEIRALKLASRKPWYSDDQKLDSEAKQKKKDSKFLRQTYAPLNEEIFDPVADQLFYCTTKQRSTNLLVKFSSQMYSVSNHGCKALIGLDRSTDGTKWFFMFLYEKHEPNIKAHITFVSLDMTELDMLQSAVIKHFMDQTEYDDLVKSKQAAFTVTRNYQIPDSDYIFSLIAGKVRMISLFTGSVVGWCAPDKSSKTVLPENGLQFPPKLGAIKGRCKLAALCPDGRATRVFLLHQPINRRTEAISPSFTLTSISSAKQHLQISKLKEDLKEYERETFIKEKENSPLEQSVALDRHSVRDMPVELYMKMTLNAMIDNAVAIVTGERMTNEQRLKLWEKDWGKLQKFFNVTN